MADSDGLRYGQFRYKSILALHQIRHRRILHGGDRHVAAKQRVLGGT